MTDWHLAQFNIARAVAPMDHPAMAEFAAALDAINALADASPGFVWRLQSESGNATDIQAFDEPDMLVNMSVWESAEALFEYVYKSDHVGFLRRRKQWFAPAEGPIQVLWWIEAGTIPSVEEAKDRLDDLARNGPSARAFTFKERFPPPGGKPATDQLIPEEYCEGRA